MSVIDWTDPKIVAAIVTGLLAIVVAFVSRSKSERSQNSGSGKSQNSVLSHRVQQTMADGDICIANATAKGIMPQKPKADKKQPDRPKMN